MVETQPLTPLMRQLLTAMPHDAARGMGRSSALVSGIMVPIVMIAQAVQGQFRLLVAIEFVGVCALIVLALSGLTFADRAIRHRTGLRDDTAVRYVAPPSAPWGGRTRPYLLIDDTKIQIEPFPLRERPTIYGLDHGTTLYAQSGDLLFAL